MCLSDQLLPGAAHLGRLWTLSELEGVGHLRVYRIALFLARFWPHCGVTVASSFPPACCQAFPCEGVHRTPFLGCLNRPFLPMLMLPLRYFVAAVTKVTNSLA